MLKIVKTQHLKLFSNTSKSINGINQNMLQIPSNPLPIYIKRHYPSVVRKEFEQPISLIDLKNLNYRPEYHFKPQNIPDTLALSGVKFLRFFADVYFQKDYIRRAICLETVAAIPGLVGGLFRHLASLRTFHDNGDVIAKLLHEAENERQHLLTFLKVGKPSFFDMIVIKTVQPIFFYFYMWFYALFPRTAHRFVGYLEEEAIRSYECFEEEIKKGNIPNVDAPKSAIMYWKLPDNSKLIDVVRAVRADEAAHRDANHDLAIKYPLKLA